MNNEFQLLGEVVQYISYLALTFNEDLKVSSDIMLEIFLQRIDKVTLRITGVSNLNEQISESVIGN